MSCSPRPQPPAEALNGLIDHLFRHRAGRMVATLTRIFGPAHIDLAEDVVQEALLRALRQWSFGAIPSNPGAWLIGVARNLALDVLRRDASFRHKEDEIRRWDERVRNASDAGADADEIRDDQLRMIFTCCHEAIPRDSRVALTLKTLGGFGVSEIARAFLCAETAIEQRLVRARRRIREAGISFLVPAPAELAARLDSVLEVIYLLFNEGYGAHRGDDLVRGEIAREAIRLASLLIEWPVTRLPKAHALLALVLFQGARLPARTDTFGSLLLLSEQDRSTWDRALIRRGFHHLEEASRGDELTAYHIEAGIASCHAMAESFESTDWRQILAFYDLLIAVNPSPVSLLNRAVAVAMVHGAPAGLREIEPLASEPALRRYHLLPATRGELLRRMGDLAGAAAAFREALGLAGTGPEKQFLARRLRACGSVCDP